MATTSRLAICTTVILAVGAAIANNAWAEDWPTYRRDSQRSAVTPESLSFPLSAGWSFQPQHEPRRAWPRNFRENAYTNDKIRTLLTFDHAFHAVAADGAVFFGSSADHKIYCLDAATGRPRWEFFTEGPIRCAPTVWERNVYTGSDDGWLYCLAAGTGDLLWKHRAGPTDERLPGNEQIISRWPIRSGVVVEDGVAYCAAGLFPHREGCFLSAVDATTGRPVWTEEINQVSQGYMLASLQRLCVPAGKMPPQIYNRASGKLLHRIASPAGTFALINDDVLFAGPGLKGGEVGAVDTNHSNERLASFPGNQLIVAGDTFYLLTDDQLRAVSRIPFLQKRLESKQSKLQDALQADPDGSESVERRSQLTEIENQLQRLQDAQDNPREWVHDSDCPHAMVLAGETLILGGDNKLRAVNAIDGETVWQAEIEGQALGLAVANGRLLVSTDRGDVHCFVSRGNDSAAADGQKIRAEVTQTPPESDYAIRAANILAVAPSLKGYCLLLHSDGPGLAAKIAKNSELTVVQIERDAKAADVTRRQLDAMGLYGPRAVVHHTSAPQLPYPDYLFNLVVVDGLDESDSLPTPEEVTRLLRPFGVAVVAAAPSQASKRAESRLRAWVGRTRLTDVTMTDEGRTAVLRRGEIPGSGQWTHQYGNPGNTACSDDRLISRPLRLQWFGRPGPYRMFDRHSYTASPVYCYGHLFTLGERILYGNDAYNGTVLWSAELPELDPRVNLPRDCGFMAADEESVFVAGGDKCLRIDADSGERLPAFTLPLTENEYEYRWGYVALQDDMLFGSGVRRGAFYDDGRGPWYDDSGLGEPQYSLKVLSDFLFVASKEDQKLKWRYDGVVINSTITLGGGRMYFVENRHPQVLADESRRLAGGDTWKQLVIVALDATNGKRVWEKEVEYEQRTPVFFLGYKDETLVVMRSSGLFQLGALDASTGDLLWEKQHGWESDNHGGHRRHPVLIKDVVYQQPQAYDLKTGEVKWSTNHFGGNCGTISACNSMLFSRLSNYPGLIDLNDEASTENLVEVTRPGCWINIIPAGGMILVPEAGSGCSCAYPLHASMAFLPQH